VALLVVKLPPALLSGSQSRTSPTTTTRWRHLWGEETPLPIEEEAGWAPEPVRTLRNLAPVPANKIIPIFYVMYVICVLCLIVVPLPPGKTPFSVKINNNNNLRFWRMLIKTKAIDLNVFFPWNVGRRE
jgi:hypothetical protein